MCSASDWKTDGIEYMCFAYQHCLKLYLLVGCHSNSAIPGKVKGILKGFKILYFDFCVLQIFCEYIVSHL